MAAISRTTSGEFLRQILCVSQYGVSERRANRLRCVAETSRGSEAGHDHGRASAYPRIIDFPGSAKLRFSRASCSSTWAHGRVGCGRSASSPIPHGSLSPRRHTKSARPARWHCYVPATIRQSRLTRLFFPESGRPLMHVIAAKAVCFHEALQPQFRDYQRQVVLTQKR